MNWTIMLNLHYSLVSSLGTYLLWYKHVSRIQKSSNFCNLRCQRPIPFKTVIVTSPQTNTAKLILRECNCHKEMASVWSVRWGAQWVVKLTYSHHLYWYRTTFSSWWYELSGANSFCASNNASKFFCICVMTKKVLQHWSLI